MTLRRSFPFLIVGAIVAALFLGLQARDVTSGAADYQQLRKLEEAYAFITRNYVEDVDSARLVEAAIAGMLAELDPHSTYINAEEMRRVRESFDATFDGVGIYYEFVDGPGDADTLAVLMPIAGGPSEEAGVLAGDRIVAIDDSSAVGISNEEVQRRLRGPRGTQVSMTIRRPGFPGTLRFAVTRDEIPLETVVAAHMMDEQTGYIKLQRFARTSHDEFMTALRDLQGQGMQRLVFDLRDNAGGLMDQAVRIADEFLPSGRMIVYTDSRHANFNREYRSRSGGAFETQPVIVLVNENSASASEIVAGALQDHDRGLLVGRRTFGKGLVQQQFGLTDGSVLQMTISRYYTPSGRLIQTPYERGTDAEAYYTVKFELQAETRARLAALGRQGVIEASDLAEIESVPDSLRYRTTRGRVVFGGGGVMPDYLVPVDTLAAPLRTTISRNLDNEFARVYLDRLGEGFRGQWTGRQQDFVRNYRLSDQAFSDFLDFAATQGVTVVEQAPEDAEAAESVFVRSQLQAQRAAVETRIRAYMARRLYGIEAFYPVVQQVDETLLSAMRLWEPANSLALASR
ncbi:S41 family peptidase [soil metagenome]